MAKPKYSIGEHEFCTLDGPVSRRQERVRTVSRPGVPDHALWLENLAAEPFDLVSQVDCTSRADAETKFRQYVLLTGADPVKLVKGDVDFEATEGVQHAVLRVEQIEARQILTCVGGLNPPSEAWLVARWTLLAIPVS